MRSRPARPDVYKRQLLYAGFAYRPPIWRQILHAAVKCFTVRTSKRGFLGWNQKQPYRVYAVSYTHLDVYKRQDDPFLVDKLLREKEGIFLWCLEGLHRLIGDNYQFTVSSKAKENMEDVYKRQVQRTPAGSSWFLPWARL